MISISELVESKGYKNLMKYVYGWGASVVLIGALFKIMHFPGASPMLIVGLSIEALIFFLSAFEPLHEELDWTLVYPELAGLSDDFEDDDMMQRTFDRAADVPKVVGVPVGGGIIGDASGVVQGGAPGVVATGGTQVGGTVVVGGGSTSALSKFDELLEKGELGPELFEKLGTGLSALNNTVEQLNDMGEAGKVSKEFVNKLQSATSSIGQLDESYQKSTEVLKESVNGLSETYVKSTDAFNTVNEKLTSTYENFAEKLTNEIESVGNEGKGYSEKLSGLNNNLSALNAVYELQVKNMNLYTQQAEEYYQEVKGVAENMKSTVQHTQKLNEGVQKLEENIASLNSIYGNMLSSVNFK
jgi:archaellum component FlaC